MRSCFSGACFVMAFESQSQQACFEGHVHALNCPARSRTRCRCARRASRAAGRSVSISSGRRSRSGSARRRRASRRLRRSPGFAGRVRIRRPESSICSGSGLVRPPVPAWASAGPALRCLALLPSSCATDFLTALARALSTSRRRHHERLGTRSATGTDPRTSRAPLTAFSGRKDGRESGAGLDSPGTKPSRAFP